ncbi:MAG: hypothetical protein KME08_20120 [Aphanothece sp. CMT-3BRIN-NPC111]|jgi:hypothetical protein|nr:hypothetical protein [Aphanothece sp. CMT-3BRIN-NPC111]
MPPCNSTNFIVTGGKQCQVIRFWILDFGFWIDTRVLIRGLEFGYFWSKLGVADKAESRFWLDSADKINM